MNTTVVSASQQQQQQQEEEEKDYRRRHPEEHGADVDVAGVLHQPWIYPTFLKDTAKLRVKERYWHRRRTSRNNISSSKRIASTTIVIPDALTWRKYLRLVTKLIRIQQQEQQLEEEGSSSSYRWILLESAAELLDYRNQSPVVPADDHNVRQREVAATHERAALIRLVQEQQRDNVVGAFCDLCVRQRSDDGDGDDDDDEWDWLHYDQLSITERSRHALIRAGRMFMDNHDGNEEDSATEAPAAAKVILIVSDEEHKKELDQNIQLDDGMIALSMEEFLLQQRTTTKGSSEQKQQELDDSLLELLEACNDEYNKKNHIGRDGSQQQQDEEELVLSPEQIQDGLRNKTLFRGRLDVTKYNPKEAFVSVVRKDSGANSAGAGSGEQHNTYFIDNKTSSSRYNSHHAFHQDVVIIRPLPKSQWGRPIGKQRLVHNNNNDDDDDDDNLLLLSTDIPSVPTARIVAISNPSRRSFVATMIDEPKLGETHALVVPMDVRIPKIRILSKSSQNYVSKRLIVHVDGWDTNSMYPHGRCIDIIGTIGDLETELQALLYENQIDLLPFSNAALACLPIEGDRWTIPHDEVNARRDLRTARHIFSVDPPGCQDIDDTMHAYELPNGDIEIGVHIADVTYFVKHNSALDIEAQKRGTTFYLVDRRFDMLPSLLSSDLCSLHGETDRLAVSVIWTMSSDLETIKSCWYGRTVIHNCAAMTYEQADNILEGKPPDAPGAIPPPPLTAGSPVNPNLIPNIKQALTTLTRLARKLRGDREAIGGAVDLSSGESGTELKFTLVDGKPTKVIPKKDKEIHHTIAELMILANTYVATKIYKTYPDSALLRIHRTVEEDRFSDLREMLEAGGISLKGASNYELANTLKSAQQRMRNNPTLNALFKSLATRAMSEAQYVCTGGDGNNDSRRVDFSHYGLGLEHYTHFTSPIRRYADIVVHKQLLMALKQEREASLHSDTSGSSEPHRQNEVNFSVPESNVVSILAGEGIEGGNDNDDIDALIEGASELALGPSGNPSSDNDNIPLPQTLAVTKRDTKPYVKAEVSRICEGLNLHTRLAKHSSMECQQLFLSLYFRDNVEMTSAVVVSLRSNGFWAYVPRFDLRVPIYLMDMLGQLQVDPALLGLSPNAGLEPTAGFAVVNSQCRRFPNGKCELIKSQSPTDDERLEVSVADSNFTVRPLNVVTVRLTCDNWDVRARVPSPRAQLISSVNPAGSTHSNKIPKQLDITSEQLIKDRDDGARDISSNPKSSQSPVSIFEVLSSFKILPVIEEPVPPIVPTTKQVPSDRAVTIGGRFGYGGFVNSDTRSAVQEVAQQQAAADAAERRNIAQEKAARKSEYDVTKGIERSATARQQRLLAEKRNARRSKAK